MVSAGWAMMANEMTTIVALWVEWSVGRSIGWVVGWMVSWPVRRSLSRFSFPLEYKRAVLSNQGSYRHSTTFATTSFGFAF